MAETFAPKARTPAADPDRSTGMARQTGPLPPGGNCMERTFDVLFFDLGGTLRLLYDNAPHQERAISRIAELVGTDMEPHAFVKLLDERYETYRKVAFDTCWEATEAELWTRWMTPDYPRDRIIANAVDLSFAYRQVVGERLMAPHSKEVVIELHRRGYRLGIISNLITSQEVPD